MTFDTIIRGGTVATASDTFRSDVGISAGRITTLGLDLGAARQVIDATDRLVLPGGIDSHVHISQPNGPGIVIADNFESGTRAAAFGGNTMVLPFCLQERGQSLGQAVRDYHAKADGNCCVDVSFHLIISDPTEQVLGQELPALIKDGYTSFKVFMTYEDLALSDRQILEVMSVARETGALVMVHAENFDAIRFLTDRLERAGKTAPRGRTSFRWVPNGIPDIETRLPILFSEGVSKGRIDLNRFVALSATNHDKTYGLYPRKGTIAVGSDADIAIWDPKREVTISQQILHHGADYTPYEGLRVTGWPMTTLVRGEVVVSDGALTGRKDHGQHLARDISSFAPPLVSAGTYVHG
ncbi:amidohydrolase family protein [Bradyrhizobium sp. CER78]|uniref:amidohydrolase family protein n=1 Tax=Bradyrhizobium sp. CER78 TaxID=3039162 RepID=UPI00244B8071|nr:amidohydrolase family protein [Bradyrhizobium sp. CER78]MDH2384092.1 amidohydrolase family protein [Bradyrhizobium sp. CER78]